ncbi:MAG: C25 family cysteine peptidase [Candidatus Sulfotelmatobacter sp.]
MMLAVTVNQALKDRYGASGYQKICAALDSYAEAAGVEGENVIALDDAGDMGAYGIAPALGGEAGSLLLALRSLRRSLPLVQSILLVGGDDIIPYCKIANPVDRSVDADAVVLSDNPYGTNADTLEEYMAPPVAVGRLTDFPRGSADDFVQLINGATASRKARAARSRAAALVLIDWSKYSGDAASSLPGVDWYYSPGFLLSKGTCAEFDREYLYFNLHGFDGTADWKGYDSVRESFVTAVTPDAFDPQYVSGSVAFAENCYGAQTGGRTPGNCCALALVQAGAAFVGATGLAYGSHLAPNFFLDDADALASSFWTGLASGVGLGEALRQARADYWASTDTPQSNPFKQKTLLQFILLGDPGWN